MLGHIHILLDEMRWGYGERDLKLHTEPGAVLAKV